MARKATARSIHARGTRPRKKVAAPAAAAARRATIRMYRLGVGDCFLVCFPQDGREDFRILIDCGVHQAQSGGSRRIKESVQDLNKITKGRIDVVVGTHEHQDHLSGFPEVRSVLGEGCAGELRAAWTENEDDAFAKGLRTKKDMR